MATVSKGKSFLGGFGSFALRSLLKPPFLVALAACAVAPFLYPTAVHGMFLSIRSFGDARIPWLLAAIAAVVWLVAVVCFFTAITRTSKRVRKLRDRIKCGDQSAVTEMADQRANAFNFWWLAWMMIAKTALVPAAAVIVIWNGMGTPRLDDPIGATHTKSGDLNRVIRNLEADGLRSSQAVASSVSQSNT